MTNRKIDSPYRQEGTQPNYDAATEHAKSWVAYGVDFPTTVQGAHVNIARAYLDSQAENLERRMVQEWLLGFFQRRNSEGFRIEAAEIKHICELLTDVDKTTSPEENNQEEKV